MDFRQGSQEPSELVVGIIGPIGCNREHVIQTISQLAKHYRYKPIEIKVSDLIRANATIPDSGGDQYLRVKNLISAGNELRKRTKDHSILAKLVAIDITKKRPGHDRRNLFIVDSIKHPEEVEELRHIYGQAFYLIAVSSPQNKRDEFLRNKCHISDPKKRLELIDRDRDENIGYGQSTSEAFHRSDFFLAEDGDSTKVWNTLERFFDIIFGDPFKTPTFHEYSMFMAYGASIRSADLSRQVGAVITQGTDIIATGANECPSPFGGTYWPIYNRLTGAITDTPQGRDHTHGYDRNAQEKILIIEKLLKDIPAEAREAVSENIKTSGLSDITEFGRVVHAEMDAILTCARRGLSTHHATIFCTTFPCHNCAKHIIAGGIRKVVYIEPYPKSKAFDFHADAISGPDGNSEKIVIFSPFVGVGPRQFVDLFSLTLSAGAKIRRKAADSHKKVDWKRSEALPRVKTLPASYQDNESTVEQEAVSSLASIDPIVIP